MEWVNEWIKCIRRTKRSSVRCCFKNEGEEEEASTQQYHHQQQPASNEEDLNHDRIDDCKVNKLVFLYNCIY